MRRVEKAHVPGCLPELAQTAFPLQELAYGLCICSALHDLPQGLCLYLALSLLT